MSTIAEIKRRHGPRIKNNTAFPNLSKVVTLPYPVGPLIINANLWPTIFI